MFVTDFKDEAVTQDLHDGGKAFRAEDARRSAAPMQPGDTERPGQDVADKADLALERLPIGRDDIVTQRLLGVAAAVETEFAAIRHVQIDRNGLARVDAAQPPALVGGADVSRELGSRRIGRISRHLKSGVTADDVVHGSTLFLQTIPPRETA